MPSQFKRKKHKGGIEGVMKRVKADGTVDVGIIDAGVHDDSPLTVASIGYINEYGTDDGRIPERPFFRSTLKEEKSNVIKLQKKQLGLIMIGRTTTENALAVIGTFMRDKIAEKIVSLKSPANAPGTLAAKAPRTNPLIDTGQLHTSITYGVNR